MGDGSTDSGVALFETFASLPINIWHSIVVTYDGSIIRLYVDGVQKGTLSTTITPFQSTGTLRIIDPSYSIDGKVSIGRVYDRALTATEVAHNYNVIRERYNY